MVHPPVEGKNCLACHDPHGGKAAPALTRPVLSLCSDCHELTDKDLTAKHQGASLAEAKCLSCHTPHASKRAGLISANAHPGFAENNCAKCHAAGSPPGPKSLLKPASVLCASCHDIPKRAAAGAAPGRAAGAKGVAGTSGRRVHPPVQKGECVVCHTPHASSREGLLVDTTTRLCVNCHRQVVASAALAHGHPPAAKGECAKCHEPHESSVPGLLVKPALELCASCHQELTKRIAQGSPHAPVARGQCLKCHASHGSSNAGMLVTAGSALCASCHRLDTPAITSKHRGFTLAKASCVSCHDPHVQPEGKKGLLKPALHSPFARGQCEKCHGTSTTGAVIQKGGELCISCHESSRAWAKKPIVHAPFKTETGCLSCHGPHAGSATPVLISQETKLCFTCHDARMVQGKVVHPPVRDGCTDCHDPHSSNAKKLLTQDVDSLCRTCHDDMGKHFHPVSRGTDPRTGEPLTCVGCHRPHASDEERLLTHEPKRALCLQCHDPSMQKLGH